jgi:hypothetical protein
MQVDQRQVTAISLRDGRDRDCLLSRDDEGYRLSLVSKDDVVNLFLSTEDLHNLRSKLSAANGSDELRNGEVNNGWRVHEPAGSATPLENAHCTWGNVDWLSYN